MAELVEVPELAGLSGGVVTPRDVDYEKARAVYNAMIDRRPTAVARCRTVADVQTALAAARRHQLLVAVRGGGHSGPGFGTVDGGLVLDLSPMSAVEVRPELAVATAQGGATLGELDRAAHEHGLAVPAGIISTTGVGGLTLGGGHGYLSRRYGLTIDNLLEAEVVLADGSVVTASEGSHPDLFWALRGGGGNFGVVTSFTFRMHPVRDVVCGPTAWPAAATGEILSWYREFMPAQDDELYGFFATMTVPPVDSFPQAFHLHKACAVVWCYLGDPAAADEAFAPIRELKPAFDGIHEAPYPRLQSAFDGLYPPGLQWYWRGDLFAAIPDAAVEAHVAFTDELPTMHSAMHLYPVDGAVNRVGPEETAWSRRDATFSQVVVGVDPDPAKAADIRRWAVEYSEATHPYSLGAGYLNFLMDEGQDRVRAFYGANYGRLAAVKAQYDPDNVFRANQNVLPA